MHTGTGGDSANHETYYYSRTLAIIVTVKKDHFPIQWYKYSCVNTEVIGDGWMDGEERTRRRNRD